MTKNILLLVASIAVFLGSIEVVLRIQGNTFIQLDDFPNRINDYSSRFHHTRSPADSESKLLLVNPDHCPEAEDRRTVMFFGDSWVAEGGIAEGFARYVAQHDEFRCFQIINGGVGSYSPSLIMLKAEEMIEAEHPMLVVINIDETDLMDEWIRYQYGSVRDTSGELIAVLPSLPDIPDFIFYYNFLVLEEQPIYLLRLIEKLYLTRGLMRRVMDIHKRQYMLPTIENLFAPQMSDNPRVEFAEQIAYFRERVLEMITRLKRVTGTRGDVVLTHHPQYLHINGDDGKHYNDIVQSLIVEATKRSDVPFYDATQSSWRSMVPILRMSSVGQKIAIRT